LPHRPPAETALSAGGGAWAGEPKLIPAPQRGPGSGGGGDGGHTLAGRGTPADHAPCRVARGMAQAQTENNFRRGYLTMKPVLDWLTNNHAALVRGLADLVAIPSISTDGEHQKEIEQTAALTCEQMRQAGLHHVEILRSSDSNPYAYGEWLGA